MQCIRRYDVCDVMNSDVRRSGTNYDQEAQLTA